MENTIYFQQTGMGTWRAFCGWVTVATIKEIVDGETYRITYMRTPWANKRNPVKTTRTIAGNLDRAQSRITARGWA